jgi:GTP-binding protein
VSAPKPAPAERAGLPVVAIVGRPNVGKSTLFNRLVRARRAIVDDAPGVTRDRVIAPAEHGGRVFLCVDTGGFSADVPRDRAAIPALVRGQALAAMGEADCIVCVFDGVAGLAPEDRDTVALLRRSGKPVLWVVNKIDTPGREPQVVDFHGTGIETLLPVSAAHGRGIEELRDAIVAGLPAVPAEAAQSTATRIALIGRPNVGKSSLLNRLLGEERAIVTAEPGTTRDAIDTPIAVRGRSYVLIDTAGIRRRGRTVSPLERHGAVRALGTLERADIALIVLDATEGMTDQDSRLVGKALEAGRAVVILANKWDAVPRGTDRRSFHERLVSEHRAFADLPFLPVSAVSGQGLEDVFPLVARLEAAYEATLPTPALNRVLQSAVDAHPPPAVKGRALRLFYAAQTSRRPPAVTIFANLPAAIPPSYTRYLSTRFSAAFQLTGVPLRVGYRARRSDVSERPRRGTSGRVGRSSKRTGAGGRSRRR